MSSFIIEPNYPFQYSRVYDNAFLWNEGNVYVMACHRLALWCWLQQEDIFTGEYSLIHIDRHIDARSWQGPGEQEALQKILSQFETIKEMRVFESFQTENRNAYITGREMRPSITYDNFVHLAAEGDLFSHYYIYASVGEWSTSLNQEQYSLFKATRSIYQFANSIVNSSGKCIVDIDLDFFDDMEEYAKKVSDDGMLKFVLQTVAKYRSQISMITISTNDIPGDDLWEKRMGQMRIVKDILGLEIPIPIMK